MDFFNSPFWGFGQFALAAIEMLRSLLRRHPQSSQEDLQVRQQSQPLLEKATDKNCLVLLLLTVYSTSLLYVFLMRVFTPHVSYNSSALFMTVFTCLDVLVALSIVYSRVYLLIYLLAQFSLTCVLSILLMISLNYGDASYELVILLKDLHVVNPTGVLTIFLIIYAITFLFTFPAYRLYRQHAFAAQIQKKTKQETNPPLTQQ